MRNTNYDTMLQDLLTHLNEPVVLQRLARVGAATVLASLVVLLSRRRGLQLESELSIVFVRGFLQIVAVGVVIGVLLTVPVWRSGLILLGMMGGARIFVGRFGFRIVSLRFVDQPPPPL